MKKLRYCRFYLILLIFVFIDSKVLENINSNTRYFMNYIVCTIWILITIILVKLKQDELIYLKQFIYLIYLPFVIFLILAPVAYIIDYYSPLQNILAGYFSRLISYELQRIIIICVALLAAIIFKKKAISYTFYALIVDNFISIVNAILKYGIGELWEYIKNPFAEKWSVWSSSGNIASALEVHDITFTLGFFFIYFIFFENKWIRYRKIKIIICSILLILGFKRIQFVAILIVALVQIFFISNQKKIYKRQIKILGIIITSVTMAYVFIVSNKEIYILADRYNINFMSRLEYYKFLSEYFQFTPLYIGKGYSFVSKLIDNYQSLGYSYQTHSDIIRMFMEYGFIGYIVWSLYEAVYIPIKLNEKFGKKVSNIFLLFTIYAFITYLTDNTFNYFSFQMVYLLIPAVIGIETIKTKASNQY